MKRLKAAGLMGIETYYSTYCAAEERKVRALAKKYGLLESGGSDFHGANKPDIDMGTGRGGLRISYALLKDIKTAHFEKNLQSKKF